MLTFQDASMQNYFSVFLLHTSTDRVSLLNSQPLSAEKYRPNQQCFMFDLT